MAQDYLTPLGSSATVPSPGGTDYLSPTRTPQTQQPIDYLGGWSDQSVTPLEDDPDGIGLTTPFTEFGKGLWSSMTSGNIQMLGGAAEAFAAAGGHDPEGSIGRRVQQWISDPSRQTAQPMTWDEANGPLGVVSYLAGLTGSGVGSMAAPLAAGAAGAVAGSSVAPGIGTVVGGVGGAYSVGSMLNIGETYLQLRDEGVEPQTAAKWALPVGAGIGVIDTVGLSRVVGATVAKEIKQKAIGAFVAEAAKGYAQGATEEGLTELAQAAIREGVTATLTGNPDLERRALSALHEGLAGSLGGGFIGGVGRAGRMAARRPTLSEQRQESDVAMPRPDLIDGDGGKLDALVTEGAQAISKLTGDTESSSALSERGAPPVGAEVVYRTSTSEQAGQVTGFVPADDFGPDSVVLTDADGIETMVELPLQEGESFILTEEAVRQQTADTFVQDVGAVVTGPEQQAQLTSTLQEFGAPTLKHVPDDQQKDFVEKLTGDLDATVKETEQAQADQDSDLVFEEDVSDLRGQFPRAKKTGFTATDAAVRAKMGLETGDVPAARRKTYLQLLKKQAARIKKEARAQATKRADKPAPVRPGTAKINVREVMADAPAAPAAGTAPTPAQADRQIIDDPASLVGKPAPSRPRPADAQAHVPESGQQDQVVMPDGTSYPTRYEVVEAADLITSNVVDGKEVGNPNPQYNQQLQPRNLSKVEEREKIRKIYEHPDPVRLARSNSADFGAPLVAEDGIVESGNGRALGIAIGYRRGTADAYRAMVDQIADTTGMQAPVLIRRRVGALPIEERRKLTKDANRSTAAKLSTTDQAVSDSEEIGEGIFEMYRGGEMLSGQNSEFVREFIQRAVPVSERNEFVTDEGGVSAAGLARMEAAVVAHAYQSRRVVQDLVADAEPERKSIRNAMVDLAPAWARMRERIKAVDSSQDVTQGLTDAVALIGRSVTNQTPIQNFFMQGSLIPDADPMTEGSRAETAKAVLRWFYASDPFAKGVDAKTKLIGGPKMKANLERWIKTVDNYNPQQETMFGQVEPPVQRLMNGEFATPAETTDDRGAMFAVEVQDPNGTWRTMTDNEFSALQARTLEAARRIVPKATVFTEDTDALVFEGQTARGLYERGVIELAMRSTSPEKTLRHEAIHALEDMGMITRDELGALRRAAAVGGWVKKHRIDELYRDTSVHVDESIAFEYESWFGERENTAATKGDTLITRVFKRIERFLGDLERTLRSGRKAGQIFRAVESGVIGARPERSRTDSQTRMAAETGRRYTFADQKAEEAYARGKQQQVTKGTALDFIAERSKTIYESFTRIYKDLPQTEHWARAHNWLRELKESPQIADERVGRQLEKIVGGLDAREYDLLSRAVAVQSLAVDVKAKKEIPLFASADTWRTEMTRLQAELKRPENVQVAQRIRLRRTHNQALARQMVKAGLIPEESLQDRDYITHRVLEYEKEQTNIGRLADVKTPKWKRRKGTTLDISTNFLETEALWMKRAMVDLKITDTIEKFRESDYNQRKQLITAARTENRGQMDARIMDEVRPVLEETEVKGLLGPGITNIKALNDWIKGLTNAKERAAILETLEARAPIYSTMNAFRIRIAVQFSTMESALDYESVKDEIPAQHRNAARMLNVQDDGTPPWPFLKWIADGGLNHVDPSLAKSAAGLFKTFSDRRQFMKDTLGKQWLSTARMDTVLKNLVRRGKDEWAGKATWQPDEGNLMFSAQTLTERVMDKAHEVFAEVIAEDPSVASLIDPTLRAEVADLLKGATLMGGPKYQLVLDQEMADTLGTFRDEHLTSQVNTVLRYGQHLWKTMMTIFPTKIIKYNIRNVSGDVDHANAAMGWKAVKPADVAAAAKELWAVSMKGADPSADYMIAREKAVLNSGYSLEVYLDQKDAIDQTITHMEPGTGKTAMATVNKAWNKLQLVNGVRENILRLVVFRKMRAHIATVRQEYTERTKKEMEPNPKNIDAMFQDIGYGPAHREIMRGLDDWDSVAAYYSRETLGDYGNLTRAGRTLRATAIPFWSWQEINAKFYRRTFANIAHQWQESGKPLNPASAAQAARAGVLTGKVAAAFLIGRAFQWFAFQQAWNHLLFPDEEEELNDTDQRRGHLIIGKVKDEILMLPTPGALADMGRWIGFEDALAAIDHVQSGRGRWGDVVEAVGSGFVNTVAQGVTPFVKMPLELVTGIETFPDVMAPRRMRDRSQYVIRGLGLNVVTDLAGALANMGKPTQGAFHILSTLAVDRRPADYSAYSQIRAIAYQYKSHVSGEKTFLGPMQPNEEAFYNYRLALRFGDENAQARWRKRMGELKITGKRRREMLDRSRPLGMLTKTQQRQFRATLTDQERRVLTRADTYWTDTFSGQ